LLVCKGGTERGHWEGINKKKPATKVLGVIKAWVGLRCGNWYTNFHANMHK